MGLHNMVGMSTTTTGTGTITLGSALTGLQSFASGGVVDGEKVPYSIKDANGNWEVGLGTYTALGTTLSRDAIYNSSNSGSAINLSGSAEVRISLLRETLLDIYTPNPPAVPSAYDDEFNSTSMDGKWSLIASGTYMNAYDFNTTKQSCFFAEHVSDGGGSTCGIWQSFSPSGDFEVTIRVGFEGYQVNYMRVTGLMIGNGSPGSWRGFGYGYENQLIIEAGVFNSTNGGQLTGHLAQPAYQDGYSNYFKIQRVGSTWYYYSSPDGLGWIRRYAETQPFTPTSLGLVIASLANMTPKARAYFDFIRVVEG